eukprot:659561-Pyramimonas_sp.AAC.1
MQLAQSRRAAEGVLFLVIIAPHDMPEVNRVAEQRGQVQRAGPSQRNKRAQSMRSASVCIRRIARGADQPSGIHPQSELRAAEGVDGALGKAGVRGPRGRDQVHEARQVLRPADKEDHAVPGGVPQGGDIGADPARRRA